MVWGAITPTALILILVIVILLFGTKKLRNIGADLGEALRNFRKSVKDGENKPNEQSETPAEKLEQGNPPNQNSSSNPNSTNTNQTGNVYQGEVVNKDKKP